MTPKNEGAQNRRGRHFTTDAKAAPVSYVAPVEENMDQNTNELATRAASQVSTNVDYGDYSGAGMEDVGQNEMLVPFVRIVQPTAGILKESSPGYNEDAKQGMMLNTASGEMYNRASGFDFIPCFRQGSYTEWVPVDAGGGFRGSWSLDDPKVLKLLKEQGSFKALKTTAADGVSTELVETYTLYGIVLPIGADGKRDEGLATPGVLNFSSTQIKKYKQVVTRLTSLSAGFAASHGGVRPPIFGWVWHVTTVPEKNKKGDYYGWQIHLAADTAEEARLNPSSPLFERSRELFEMVRAGFAQADHANSGTDADHAAMAGGGGGGSTGSGTGQVNDEIEGNIPF